MSGSARPDAGPRRDRRYDDVGNSGGSASARVRGASASGSGYFTSRSQIAKIANNTTSSATHSQLPSGPTVPPVSHAGPENLALSKCPGETVPLSGTP